MEIFKIRKAIEQMAKDGMDMVRQIEAEKELFKALRERLRKKPHLISTSVNFDNLIIQTSVSESIPSSKMNDNSGRRSFVRKEQLSRAPPKLRRRNKFPQLHPENLSKIQSNSVHPRNYLSNQSLSITKATTK